MIFLNLRFHFRTLKWEVAVTERESMGISSRSPVPYTPLSYYKLTRKLNTLRADLITWLLFYLLLWFLPNGKTETLSTWPTNKFLLSFHLESIQGLSTIVTIHIHIVIYSGVYSDMRLYAIGSVLCELNWIENWNTDIIILCNASWKPCTHTQRLYLSIYILGFMLVEGRKTITICTQVYSD